MQEINLYQLLQYYAKKWVVIVAFTVTGLVTGLVYSFSLQTPLYKSDATLILIDPEKTTATAKDPTLINNYIELFKSRKVLEPVIEKLNLDTSYEELVGSITATSEKDTEVIKVSASSENAETSMMVTDETIASFKQEVGRLYDKDNIEIVDRANRPTVPYNVHATLQVIVSMTLGLVAALTLLFFAYDFSRSKTEKPIVKKRKTPKKVPEEMLPLPAAPPVQAESLPDAKELESSSSRPPVSDVVSLLIGTEMKSKRKKARKQKASKRNKK